MSAAGGGGIFISYRREESSYVAGRLADRLIDRFGAEQVFIDVEAIEPGMDFAEAIFRAVDACVALVAVIGPGWLLAADGRGGRRLDDPDDLVRLEIGTALERGVRVIPVLAEDALMPRREDLPESLAGLARRNALRIRHESFRDDAGRLVAVIERVLTLPAVTGAARGVRPAADLSGAAPGKVPRTGQKDPARAARLLDDAERAAYAVTNVSARARALIDVAQAGAVIDPDRAARLAGDAERIANSSPDVTVLRDVAGAVAVIDPGRAERIADSMNSEWDKALALSVVARAVAATDPDRAERIANSITQGHAKVRALGAVAGAVAVTDPGRAARLAGEVERIASSVKDHEESALNAVPGAVAIIDPDRAERIANSLTKEWARAQALGAVARAVAVTDPGRAARLADEAERIANSLTEEYSKAEALSVVAGAVAVIDPDRAERIANSITKERWGARALSSIAKALAT